MTPTAYKVTNYANLASSFGSVVNAYTAGKLKRTIARHNATMAGYKRYWSDKKMNQQLEILYDDEARYLGAARASAGGSGFSVASKTNRDIEMDIMRNVGKEALVIRAEGGLANMRIDSKISQFKTQARNARTEGAMNTATALSKTTQSKGFTNLFKKG